MYGKDRNPASSPLFTVEETSPLFDEERQSGTDRREPPALLYTDRRPDEARLPRRQLSRESNDVVISRRKGMLDPVQDLYPSAALDHSPHDIFVELDELVLVNHEYEWTETARWIKYEENLEEGSNKWGPPHMSTLSFHSLLNLRKCLEQGVVLLDMEADDFSTIVHRVADQMVISDQLHLEQKGLLIRALMLRHHHVDEHHGEGFFRGIKRNGISSASLHTMSESRRSSYRPTPSVTNLEIGSYSNGGSVAPSHPKANASTPNFGQLESSGKNLRHDLLKVKISQDAPVPIPTRFMFILLGPTSCDLDFHEIGRALGTLMSNKDFHDVAYKTMVRRDILFAINEFLDDSIVLPPGDWSRKSLLPFEDLKEKSQSIAARKKREEMEKQQEAATKSELPLVPVEEKKAENPLEKTGKFFGGLVRDIKSRYPKYLSDITDFPNSVCIAATVFIYFAALSGAITFGGLYADKTKNQIGVSETLIATALAGIVFSMLSGQPLIIIGATGPVLLFDEAFYTVRRALGDFGVPIAIVIMVIIDNAYDDAYTEKLSVPDGLSPSDSSLRGWIINPLGTEDNPVGIGMMFAAAIPALLVFILIFMETEICESIINKKCKKSLGGHHLDILLLCLINVFVTIMGAPWMPAATVRSVSHVSALTVLTTNQAPGEAATVAEIKEQRLSTFLVSVLIGVSVLMSPLLRKVPVAVLFGVFLYMGVSSMNGIQLFERMALLLKPSKHHPRVDYVRRVTTWKMHAFTIIQIFCLAILWVVKSTEAALAFPFFLILMIPIRKLLEKVFSPRELIALDGKDAQTTGEDDDEPDFYVEAKIL
ncbi:unnamed protein product [Cyprideis torosa]|uniref:Uncharacterized protein n=1 Tax=Cyprideis torosa TaxID=163714 RepID=A0A7R8ZHS7_9CRUS|nr:unnamed protein product [Cyprideis torosa]CAG0884444.1 unnamed protein product [Cyprideis torosa]